MLRIIYFWVVLSLVSCKTTTYFIVRHAEKEATATMTTDVPLSAAGRQRAEALKTQLLGSGINTIYSTNFIRTRETVRPLAEATGVQVQLYNPGDTGFVAQLKQGKGKILVVGHSNTVDNLVNGLSATATIPGDLPETQYGDLFIIRKKGKKTSVQKSRFGL